jgi:hypothetical protein
MNRKQILVLTLLGTLSFSSIASLYAWQRSAESNCLKEEQECRQEIDDSEGGIEERTECNRDFDECSENIKNADEASFMEELSKTRLSQFQNMTDKQKKEAMDYADNNSMTPGEAVDRVYSKRRENY